MKTALLRRTAGGRSAGFLSAFALAFGCALVASTAQNSFAATLTVTTTKDEANCNTTNSGSPNPACVVMNTGGNNYPLSQGCSLREALQNIADAGNGISPQSFPECGNADSGAAATNTIVLPAGNINVNEAVPDPGDSTGMAMKNNGTLPFVGDAATFGKVIVTGGSISCFSDPSATPAIDGVTIFHETSGGDLTFAGVSFSNCTAPSDGVAIDNTGGGGGSLTLTGVAFTNIRATNQGNGGCVAHGSGNLTIAGGSFTTCVVDDGGLIPGGGNGQGGALYIGAVGDSTLATISGVTFQANVAGTNGGAIYLAQTDAISISGAAFQANVANGNTNSSGNAEQGGGAIYATGTARQAISGGGGFNASDFLIFNSSFIGNIAPNGTGGAILLTGGDLTYGSASFDGTVILNKQIPGGIVACNFTGNKAKGTWAGSPVDPRAGSGGAIYASGNLSIVDSSFVGASPANNESTNASGGAIAYYDASNGNSPMAISNVTFSGNAAATNGGAIAILLSPMTNEAGKATLINDTLSGNSAGAGGGGALYNGNATATDVNVSNTIFDSSSSGGNCAGNPFTDGGGNLQFGPTSGCASIANTGNPNLASAAPFGGANALVAVMKLNPGSAASGAGVQSICAASPINNLDAALNSRPSGQPNCDVGAFESGNAPAYASNPTPGSTINMTTLAGTPTSSNVVISNTGTDNLVINTYSLDAGAGPQITVNGAPAPFTIPVGSSTQTLTLGCDNATAGPFTGTLTVTHNAQGSPATYTVNCTVTSPGNPLSITTTSPLPQATVGTLYNQTFAATGGTPPYTNWAITAGTFPSWANLNAATGAMTGTPPDTTGSPFSFTVQVTDSAMVTATKVFTLDVVAPPLSITTTSPLPQATVNTMYSQTFAATGGTPPYTNWAITAGTFPAWANLNAATGAMTGTPPNTTGSPFTFTVQVTDSAMVTATKQFTLTVVPPPLSITTLSPLPQATVNTMYNQTFAATGGTPPYTNWAITAGTFPPWANLNAATGATTGTPPNTTGSPFSFTVQVTDSAMVTATKVFSLQVAPPPLTITTTSPLPAATVNTMYNQTFGAAGGTPPYVNWQVVAGTFPSWASLNAATGAMTGTPPDTTGSPFNFTIQVKDTANVTTTKAFSLTVMPKTPVTLQDFHVD